MIASSSASRSTRVGRAGRWPGSTGPWTCRRASACTAPRADGRPRVTAAPGRTRGRGTRRPGRPGSRAVRRGRGRVRRGPARHGSRFSFSARARAASRVAATAVRATTMTPSSSATIASPGQIRCPPMLTGTLTAPAVALTVPCAETAAQKTGKPIACSSATSRTPPVVTRPRTPRCCSDVPSSSPNAPSVFGDVVVTTRMSPGRHCSTAAWIIRLSPGQHRTVTAVPPVRAPEIDRPDGRAEVAGPACRLVHGRDAERRQFVDRGQVGARAAGDDHVPHRSTSVTCG